MSTNNTQIKDEHLDETQKWVVIGYTVILFLIVSSRFTYKITGSITELIGWKTSSYGVPNLGGLILHAVVFALLLRLVMLLPKPDI